MLSPNDKKNVATSIGLSSWPTFGQFLENLSILEAPLSNFFTVPITTNQSYWIDDTIDLIIKIENLDTDIAPIEAMVSNGSLVELHPLYVNNYIGNYKDFYTKTTEEIIRKLFAEDIGKFNYTFGG